MSWVEVKFVEFIKYSNQQCKVNNGNEEYLLQNRGSNVSVTASWLIVTCKVTSDEKRVYIYINFWQGKTSKTDRVWSHSTYVEIKCQLDATDVFIAELIACSTCFGHHYAHHQELNTLELLMMGIVIPETCWASNKICNRNLYCI